LDQHRTFLSLRAREAMENDFGRLVRLKRDLERTVEILERAIVAHQESRQLLLRLERSHSSALTKTEWK
jgi:hypothetical protein